MCWAYQKYGRCERGYKCTWRHEASKGVNASSKKFGKGGNKLGDQPMADLPDQKSPAPATPIREVENENDEVASAKITVDEF